MNLIIVESPTKARTLSRFLGDKYVVKATTGHIKDLPKSKIGVDVENNFAPDYVVVEKRKSSINDLLKTAKTAKGVYLATDPDREGEAIAQHAYDVLIDGKKPAITKDKIKRIVFHEITENAVTTALSSPRSIDKDLVNAQIARRVLDRLVGYKLSPVLWKKVRRGLSAGRVQTVVVRLIVDREREVEAFKPIEYWEIFCDVLTKKDKGNTFTVKLAKVDGKRTEVSNGKDASKIISDLEDAAYKVENVQSREVSKAPRPPYTTSTMTQAAASLLGWSAKRTMSVAQKLYEEGFITYHRTDSTHVSKSAIERTRKYIQKNFGEAYLVEKPRIFKTKSKLAQEAHEAVRPTKMRVTPDKFLLTNGEESGHKKLYSLIWKKFTASQMSNGVFDETKIEVEATAKNRIFLLRASGQIMKFEGWRKVIPLSKNEEPQLPYVSKDQKLKLKKVKPEQKFTQPPPRYNEASLIKMLEKLGIGRPSTYAPTISTIQIRNYVEKIDGRFHTTPVGIAVNDFLLKNFKSIFEYSFTKEMEDDLDNVARGKRKWANMMKEFYNPFEKKVESVEEKAKRVKIETEKLGKKCPTCKKGDLVIRIGRFGKFVSCSRFPECKHTDKYEDRIGIKCLDCKKGNIIVKRTRKGRTFYGCSRYPECEFASWTKPENKTEEKAAN